MRALRVSPKHVAARATVRCNQRGGRDEQALLTGAMARRAEGEPTFWKADKRWYNFRKRPGGPSDAPIQVSGSSQPDPRALTRLARDERVNVIVDLREEEHGFLTLAGGDSEKPAAISAKYTNYYDWTLPGIATQPLLAREKRSLAQLGRAGAVALVPPGERDAERAKPAKVRRTESEADAVARLRRESRYPVTYVRIPVTDWNAPEPRDVDRLVSVYQSALRWRKNIHFHCAGGKGRTTTAMALADIMDGMSVKQALKCEAEATPPGINLRRMDPEDAVQPLLPPAAAMRLGVLYRFHKYWNSPARNKMTFSRFMKIHPIDYRFLDKMHGKLKIEMRP